MAGVVCKIIINQLIRAISEGLEGVLTSGLVRGAMLPVHVADELLDRLVSLDLDCYDGAATAGGDSLGAIVAELVKHGVLTEEIWRVLKNPAEVLADSEAPGRPD